MYTKIYSLAHTASNSSVRARDNKAKAKLKSHADSHCHAASHTLTPGDTVLLCQPKHNKLTTPYNSKPYTVTKVKVSMVTPARDGHFIVRNSSSFKKITAELLDIPPDPDDDDFSTVRFVIFLDEYDVQYSKKVVEIYSSVCLICRSKPSVRMSKHYISNCFKKQGNVMFTGI